MEDILNKKFSDFTDIDSMLYSYVKIQFRIYKFPVIYTNNQIKSIKHSIRDLVFYSIEVKSGDDALCMPLNDAIKFEAERGNFAVVIDLHHLFNLELISILNRYYKA